ncbi:MAG: RluA family pseudouridine synthase [Oscillospiraceae bacterium]|nr:RluA family pseudouridine synthase [Oscillospiraceae bacterium]
MDIKILYEDNDIIACVKPPHVLSQRGANGGEDMISLLGGSVYPVHRLDGGVGGVMVYAKTQNAAGKLSQMIAARDFEKEYLAILRGKAEESGTLRDLLFHDRIKNKTYVVDRMRSGVKEASLSYRLVETREMGEGVLSLVRVKLHTGRTHQIRVQFASRGLPLLGDGRYGGGAGEIALWSYRLRFAHPTKRGKVIEAAQLPPEGALWSKFDLLAVEGKSVFSEEM